MKRIFLLFCFLISFKLQAQLVKIPQSLQLGHPCLYTNAKTGKQDLQKLLKEQDWARNCYQQALESIEPYVLKHQTDTSWIVSRLQMYWKSHASQVYVKGPVFSHADGNAPVPTVRYTGSRDAVTSFTVPKLEDILPYMEDERGLFYANKSKPGNPLEWVEPAKAGRNVESINRKIMGMAETAAFAYWNSGDERYARFAADLFDTYMMGMYYRKEPIDITHSHIQTLVGLSSFEVIHEDVLNELTACYDFLFDYLAKHKKKNMPFYADCFKKWADLIIKNGIPFNNWNLIQARFVCLIAFVLEDNDRYADGKGSSYYLNQLFNNDYTRQWSLPKLMDYGYDPKTALWNESAGYSSVVIGDFASFVSQFDKSLRFDLCSQLPLIAKAVETTPEYLFPNGYIVGFGDTHWSRLSSLPAQQMVENARFYGKAQQEYRFSQMIKMLQGFDKTGSGGHAQAKGYQQLFTRSEFVLSDTLKAGKYQDFVSPLFYSPNVSWLVQRNGFDAKNGLMLSIAGSKGNHAHANGIAMEMYTKGLILAPEGGIGTSYFQADYKEYYSQFPAHNTVVVDGISSYPEMRSNHAYELKACYPVSGQKKDYFSGMTFSEMYFLEPETNADQNRQMATIRTSDSSVFVIDIFRSKKKAGKDKRHDYFYHNLGQELTVFDSQNKALKLSSSETLAYANGDMFAYDYLWDKKSVKTASDINARFRLSLPARGGVWMNMWIKGEPDREIYTMKAPPSKCFSKGMLPDSIQEMPLPTLVARQYGEAWHHPFAVVYEATDNKQSPSVVSIHPFLCDKAKNSFVGLDIETKDTHHYVFSLDSANQEISYLDQTFKGTYSVVSKQANGLKSLFMGNGTQLCSGEFGLKSSLPCSAVLWKENNKWFITASSSISLYLPENILAKNEIKMGAQTYKGKKEKLNGKKVLRFDLPKTDAIGIE